MRILRFVASSLACDFTGSCGGPWRRVQVPVDRKLLYISPYVASKQAPGTWYRRWKCPKLSVGHLMPLISFYLHVVLALLAFVETYITCMCDASRESF